MPRSQLLLETSLPSTNSSHSLMPCESEGSANGNSQPKSYESAWSLRVPSSNTEMLRRVAEALRPLDTKVVFVGGATIALYLDEYAASLIPVLAALAERALDLTGEAWRGSHALQ